MATYIFNGECQSGIKQAFIDTYLPNLELVVETTAVYKKSGIYSATRDDVSKPVVIDWGDGTIEQIDGDISQKVHEYATVSTFNVVIKNIRKYAASANNTTWYNTTSQNAYTLKEVVAIPDAMTSIAQYAFMNCKGLTSVTIPDSVTVIGQYAFWGCRGLTSVTIPDSMTGIAQYAFAGTGLTSVTIPDSIIAIGDWTFWSCSRLTSVTIGNGVERIQDRVFSGCGELTSVTIGNSVTSIGSSAFSHCSKLTSITIPNNVTSIWPYAFSGCSGLMSISVGAGNANYKSVNGLLLSKDGTRLIQGVNGDVTIPDSVTSIGSSAFEDYSGLTSVTIPDSVTSIGGSAFYGCSGLTSVTIPDSVTSIGERALSGCSSLTSVVFEGKTLAEVQAMISYPWDITDTSIITVI